MITITYFIKEDIKIFEKPHLPSYVLIEAATHTYLFVTHFTMRQYKYNYTLPI